MANSIDNNGDALYGGFSTEGSPFVQNEEGQTRYRGDGGEHILQVSESVKLPTSLNGSSLFMEVKDGAGTKSSFDILDSFANALLTDSQFEQSYSANSADTAQSISYDLTNSSMVGMFDFDTGESQQNLAASTGIQPGEFTFTINDTPTTITITDGGNDTLQGLIDEINAISNVTANLVQEDSGLTLQITSTAGAENAFSISSSDAELVVLQTGVPASSSTSAQLTVVSEAADAVSGAMKLRINASREPQNWSMVLTGPEAVSYTHLTLPTKA